MVSCPQDAKMDAILASLHRLEYALVGDPAMRVKGALQKVEEHGERIVILETSRLKVAAWIAGASFAGGSLGALALKLLA